MTKFALGWRKDRPGVDMPGHHLVKAVRAASTLAPLAHPSLLPFRGRRLNQGGVGSCWAFATVRIAQLYWQANEMATDMVASPKLAYYDGRLQEYAGQDPETIPPLSDTGTEPRLGMQAWQNVGCVAWDDCPYVGEPDNNNVQPAPDVYEKAYDQKGMQFARVTDVGKQRIQAVSDAMIARIPFEFGMQVDSAFMDNHGERITSINPNQIEGGHMLGGLVVLDSQLLQDIGGPLGLPQDTQVGDVIFDNWWGDGSVWGTKDGFGVMAGSLFGSQWISDVLLMKSAPLIRKLTQKAA